MGDATTRLFAAHEAPSFRAGQVLTRSNGDDPLYLLIERGWRLWPTWESTGKWWQWRIVDLLTGEESWVLENSIERMIVLR